MSRTPAEAAAVAAVTAVNGGTGREALPADDGEPSHPVRAGLLYVPVRPCPVGFALRVFRTPLGGRTAVAFTSPRRLEDCLGRGVPHVRLALPAVRALAGPLGVRLVRVDPQLTAPAVRPSPDSAQTLLPTFPG
ncbi:SAV_915 family protein [Streptomyces sp. NPDC053048]|uniref:SAV_915 family protein n=1 Tax=Streptomyces sp. NPDC053048 TaxID=3365694 RepID=UPI0037D49385